ncbi:MAG TPA: lyase family protein, partial [Clostridiales bacterium]|nr:lyase family protein [Clostridiales bacterium]
DDLIDATQNLDGYVSISGAIKTCAVNLSKISNDLRLMNSGPKDGLCEIVLPAKQNGSSIMPGKINPVIPEVVTQVAFNIVGNDMAITMAAEAGQLELNAFEPVLFYNLFESIETLGHAATTLADNCVVGITANEDVCRENIEKSAGIVTALCPVIGYQKSAEIAKKVLKSGKSAREYLLEEGIMTNEEIDKVLDPEKLVHPIYKHKA